jgi:hypothetical protein
VALGFPDTEPRPESCRAASSRQINEFALDDHIGIAQTLGAVNGADVQAAAL